MNINYDHYSEYMGCLCQCGKSKKARMSFCPNCFFRLPDKLRKNLYKTFGRGYEEAYDAAVEYLNK